MKHLVETKSSFQLFDMMTAQMIPSDRPAVVTLTPLFNQRVTNGQLRVLSELCDDATDVEFSEYLADSGTLQLALDSFIDKFKAKVESDKDEDNKDDGLPDGDPYKKPATSEDRVLVIADALEYGIHEEDLQAYLQWKPGQKDLKEAIKLNGEKN